MRDHMDPVLGRALEDELAALVAANPAPSSAGTASRDRRIRSQAIWVTVVVGVVVVIVAAFTIRAGQRPVPPAVSPASPTAAASTSTARLGEASLLSRLPSQPYGRAIHTWTDQDAPSTTGPFRFVGSTAVIAAVCDGGGAIAITDTAGSVHKESCTHLDVQQPFWKADPSGDGRSAKTTGPVHVAVTVQSGDPRFIVRLWAVDPRILDANRWSVATSSASVPASLRTCTAADIAPTGSVQPAAGTTSGVVTITSRSATDCAIRDWPTMQYLAGGGHEVGPRWGSGGNGLSLDSSEGKLDKYGQFQPARLTAGGSAYLIVDLVPVRQLREEDTQQKEMPRPTPSAGPSLPGLPACDPQRVTAIRLDIGRAAVTVPVPDALGIGACTTSTRQFGVNPVVARRPTVQR